MNDPVQAHPRRTFLDGMSLDARLFLLLLLLEWLMALGLNVSSRIPRGYDTLWGLSLQYTFANHVAMYGELPRWLPFEMHGMVGNMAYLFQGDLLHTVLMGLGSGVKGMDFLPLYYLSIWFDHLLLATGCWLLGRRYFETPQARFFVCIAILGSAVWTTQHMYNFHGYYALPLILHGFHRWMDSGRFRYLAYAGIFLFGQLPGNIPYLIPVQMFALCTYLTVSMSVDRSWGRFWQLLRQHPFRALVVAIVSGVAAWMIWAMLRSGSSEVINVIPNRNSDGTVSLDNFLHYNCRSTLEFWQELYMRISPGRDYTLYAGYGTLLMMGWGWVSSKSKSKWIFMITGLSIILLSLGGTFATMMYHLWPGMKYFRHLTLIQPIGKLFLCFLAGLGVDQIVRDGFPRIGSRIAAILMLLVGVLLIWHLMNLGESMLQFRDRVAPVLALMVPVMYPKAFAFGLCMALGMVVLWGWFFIRVGWKGWHTLALPVLLLIQTLDLYGYKAQHIFFHTLAMNPDMADLYRFQPVPFSLRRLPEGTVTLRKELWKVPPRGIWHQSINNFLFEDQLNASLRVDQWLKGFDRIIRALWRQPLNDRTQPVKGYEKYRFVRFPELNDAESKMLGVDMPKIQLFKNVIQGWDDDTIAKAMVSSGYRGNVLMISHEGSSLQTFLDEERIGRDDRLEGSFKITQFNMNHLDVVVTPVPSDVSDGAWFYYSDVWHPGWKVQVNGTEQPVYRANLGYKAVHLPSGPSKVEWVFRLPLLEWAQRVHFWISLILVLAGVLFAGGVIRSRRELNENPLVRKV